MRADPLCDIEAANALKPDYIGFVFAPRSQRYVDPETARALRRMLSPDISGVGIFANEEADNIGALMNRNVIDVAQLHSQEDEAFIHRLRELTDKPIIKAFRIDTEQDALTAQRSSADFILLDSGDGGTGAEFDWRLLCKVDRPFFLAGGLNPDNVRRAIKTIRPYAVDVSSGIETNKLKDAEKMRAFVRAVREQP